MEMNLTENGRGVDQSIHEGGMTRAVENQTAKIQSINYLGLAVGSMVLSAGLAIFSERKGLANFVGLWAPSILVMGLYNKFVKLEAEIKKSQLH